MKKYSKKARIAVILGVILALIMSSMSASYAASGKTKKATVYDEVIVKGNYAYCSASEGIYRVNLETGAKKRLVEHSNAGIVGQPKGLKIYKGYLYYSLFGEANDPLYRVKLNGKNKKLVGNVGAYAFSKGKIYYTYNIYKKKHTVKKRVMDLNGKNKKKSKYKVKNTYKKTNKAKYMVKRVLERTEEEEIDGEINVTEYFTDYFTGPDGMSVELCTFTEDYIK